MVPFSRENEEGCVKGKKKGKKKESGKADSDENWHASQSIAGSFPLSRYSNVGRNFRMVIGNFSKG